MIKYIWAWAHTGETNKGGWSAAEVSHADAQYIRKDESDALVTAAYEDAAADQAIKLANVSDMIHQLFVVAGYDDFANRVKILTVDVPATIRARTPDDAQAAHDAAVAEAREAAIKECCRHLLAIHKHHPNMMHDAAAANIGALIDWNAHNGE